MAKAYQARVLDHRTHEPLMKSMVGVCDCAHDHSIDEIQAFFATSNPVVMLLVAAGAVLEVREVPDPRTKDETTVTE